MRGGLIQQQDRGRGLVRQAGDLGQDQVQDQGLLLAGGAFGGGAALLAVDGGQVGAVRAEQGAAGGAVAGAGAGEAGAQGGDDLGLLRPLFGHPFGLSGQAQIGLGEGSVVARVDGGLKRVQRRDAGEGGAGAGLGQADLQRVQPDGVGLPALLGVVQEAQAFAQRLFIDRDAGGVVGIGGEDQAVEELQPLGAGVREQPVLLGRGPDGSQVVQQPTGLGGLAVDADDAANGSKTGHAGAQPRLVIQFDADGPRAAGRLARLAPAHLDGRRAPQPLAGRQQADRLKQIGLPRPVRPVQHHGAGREVQPRGRVGAKVGEGEGGDQNIPLIPAEAGTQSFRSARSSRAMWETDPPMPGSCARSVPASRPVPFLDLAFAGEGGGAGFMNLVPDQVGDAVPAREAGAHLVPVFRHAADEIVGRSCIQCSVSSAGDDVGVERHASAR